MFSPCNKKNVGKVFYWLRARGSRAGGARSARLSPLFRGGAARGIITSGGVELGPAGATGQENNVESGRERGEIEMGGSSLAISGQERGREFDFWAVSAICCVATTGLIRIEGNWCLFD